MKRLVLCFDGTWNAVATPDDNTNVVRLANLVTVSDAKGVPQICYYNSGVGSGGPIDRFIGGAFGAGLKNNVKRGLAFLALNYEKGDEIYLFGFSRGGYTARALAGVLGTAGIPLDIAATEQHWNLYQEVAKLKDKRGRYPKSSRRRAPYDAMIKAKETELADATRYKGDDVPIRCVGVWDTVGAYGIPGGLGLSALSRLLTLWTRGFKDTKFGRSVKLGLHAIAVDEMRRPFVPTFWTLRETTELIPGQEVEQVWFPGVHSNVGGGYKRKGLSDLALAWMISRVQERTDLKFNDAEVMDHIWPCSACTLYPTTKIRLLGRIRNILPGSFPLIRSRMRRLWRRIQGGEGDVKIHRLAEKIHWSVRERCNWPVTLVHGVGKVKYAPPNLGPHVKEVVEPTPLEWRLLARTRLWEGRCPLEEEGVACQCSERASTRIGGPQQATAPAEPHPPSVAA
jgi:uncharacterized protein (DUF2235 family)